MTAPIVASITETNGSSSYSTAYTYDGAGDRLTATYSTPNGTTEWDYTDYTPAGDPASPSRIFQTLVKLNSSTGYPTSEEMHYAYDGAGRILQSAFAQTPASGFTPSSGASYYDSSHLASSRARAYYAYDAGGRLTQLNLGKRLLRDAGRPNGNFRKVPEKCRP